MRTIALGLLAAAVLAGPASGAPAAPHLTPQAAVTDYCAAWSVTDPAARERMLARVWAPGGVYSDPDPTYAVGAKALSEVIAKFQKGYPGARFRCGAPQAHHNFMGVSWILPKADGSPVTHGIDIYDMAPGGRIARIVGFFGDPPAP